MGIIIIRIPRDYKKYLTTGVQGSLHSYNCAVLPAQLLTHTIYAST